MSDEFVVNGLPLPPLLISLIQEGKWKHPGEEVMHKVVPFVREPVIFCPLHEMRSETNGVVSLSADLQFHTFFRQLVGSQGLWPNELPWLDVEQMVFIAISGDSDDDLGIALDYRSRMDDPRIIASDWLSGADGYMWREVAPTFTEFVERLGL